MKVTEEALDAVERAKIDRRPAFRSPAVRVASPAPLVALALLVGGTGGVLASDPLPLAWRVLAIAAVAAGGWLARGGSPDPEGHRAGLRETALARREAELNRVLTAFALRGSDVLAELARRSVVPAPSHEPVAPSSNGRGERHDLVSLPGARAGAGESLELDADDGGPLG